MDIFEKIKTDVLLKPYTSFKIGGPAKFFLEISSKEDLQEAISWSLGNRVRFIILGGGTNVLISDQGFDGLVIRINNNGINIKSERILCGAGANLIQASRLASSQELSGLEWGTGIPGTVGGAIFGNAGAYGVSVSDILETVEVLDFTKNIFTTLSHNDCRFDYKKSIFSDRADLIIWQATFKLRHGQKDEIDQLINQYRGYRIDTQPKLPSAGCIFKNLFLNDLKKNNPELALEVERLNLAKNDKVATGWLIDKLDLKGKVMGGAKVSLEHANFIVNTGKATADEVAMLVSFVKQQVRDRFGVQLYEEIKYVGFKN